MSEQHTGTDDTMVRPGAPSANWLRNKAFAWSDDPTPARYARDFACTLLLMALATLVSLAFYAFRMEACIVITYVLAVLCASLLTVGRVHCLFASAFSVVLYNYFFTTPRFSLTPPPSP